MLKNIITINPRYVEFIKGENYCLWTSKDLALIIVLAATSFVYSILVAQLPNLITGIVGLNYFFIFGHGIVISFAFLIYNGKRWRFAFHGTILALLFIPTFAMGTPFDVLARMPLMVGGFLGDLVMNSFYQKFNAKNKLMWWSVLGALFNISLTPILTTLTLYLFYSPEIVTSFVTVVTYLSPVIIIESIIGGYIGYKVFERTRSLKLWFETTSG